ncbi:hypothetical protein [Methylobacterium oryzisoli]|uniref:hypothetical protein n=1 Tax=Methylobacterium oryzisoli TaxID=3385502 RepID=UPI003891F094
MASPASRLLAILLIVGFCRLPEAVRPTHWLVSLWQGQVSLKAEAAGRDRQRLCAVRPPSARSLPG